MACGRHVGFRVEGVTEASLTSDVFVACLFQHSWRGLGEKRGGRGGEGREGVKSVIPASAVTCPTRQCMMSTCSRF